MMDLLPTLTKLAAAPQPKNKIDGYDIAPLVLGNADAKSPYDDTGFFYYQITQLQAVRAGTWKLYLPLESKGMLAGAKKKGQPQQLALFDVRNDVSEQNEVSAQHPDVVARLTALAENARGTRRWRAAWFRAARGWSCGRSASKGVDPMITLKRCTIRLQPYFAGTSFCRHTSAAVITDRAPSPSSQVSALASPRSVASQKAVLRARMARW